MRLKKIYLTISSLSKTSNFNAFMTPDGTSISSSMELGNLALSRKFQETCSFAVYSYTGTKINIKNLKMYT